MNTTTTKSAITMGLGAAVLLSMCLMCSPCPAQAELSELPAPPPVAPEAQPAAQVNPAYAHPTLPAETTWPGATVVLICGMFLAAAAVGVVIRLNTPEEVPIAHSHDEPPGTSHHHGPGGTVQPGPEHDLPGGHAEGSSGHH